MNREELVELIRKRKDELRTAGCVHGKDLRRNIRRLERELMVYDRFQERAGKENSGILTN